VVLDDYEVRFPWLPWREPLPVSRPDGVSRIACRLCTARFGLKAQQLETTPFCFVDERGFADHMRRSH
jgi:hypothetical protein